MSTHLAQRQQHVVDHRVHPVAPAEEKRAIAQPAAGPSHSRGVSVHVHAVQGVIAEHLGLGFSFKDLGFRV